jgi:hypothetical protein
MSKYFEDIVLSIAVVLGMLIGLYLSYALVVQGAQYPPTLISTFIGMALAALIYRFMGGLGGTEFGAGMLKLGGAAAFIVGFIWFVGDRLKDEVQLYSSTETYRSQIEALEKQRDNAQAVSDKQGEEIEKLRKTQLNAPSTRGVYTISEIKQMKPDNPFIQSLKRLVEGQEGPFSPTLRELVVRVSVVAGPSAGPTFYICPDTLEKLNEGVDAPSTEIQISRTLADGSAASLTAKRGGKIGQDVCINEQRDFDVQINCAAAITLFADKMTSCSEGAAVRGSKVTIGSLAA